MRLIDAETLEMEIEKRIEAANKYGMKIAVAAFVEDALTVKSAPTVDALEVHRGKWIVQKSPDRYHAGLMKCSVCGYDDVVETDEYNYCPNCGAKMEENDETD